MLPSPRLPEAAAAAKPEAAAAMVLDTGHEGELVLVAQHMRNGGGRRAAHGQSAVDHSAGRTSTDATSAGSKRPGSDQAAQPTSQPKVIVVALKGVSSREYEHTLMMSCRVSSSPAGHLQAVQRRRACGQREASAAKRMCNLYPKQSVLLLGNLLGGVLDGRRRSGLGESVFPPNPLGKIHRKTPQITPAQRGLKEN
jgi:hypothetical protein